MYKHDIYITFSERTEHIVRLLGDLAIRPQFFSGFGICVAGWLAGIIRVAAHRYLVVENSVRLVIRGPSREAQCCA